MFKQLTIHLTFCLFLVFLVFSKKAYSSLDDFSDGASLELADFAWLGENTDYEDYISDMAGYSIAGAGDVDGDGLDDLLIGAPFNNNGSGFYAGKAYLILGSSLNPRIPTVIIFGADYQFMGEASEDQAGYSVAGAGDVDGDGLGDILIGANGASKVYLFLGSSLSVLPSLVDLSLADYQFIGESDDNWTGYSIAGAGDVDGDGRDDILIGAPMHRNDSGTYYVGKSYLILASTLNPANPIFDLELADYSFIGENGSDYAGRSLAGAGDIDGNGRDDILIGASENDEGGSSAGKVYLIFGESLGSSSVMDLSTADYQFIGENTNNYAGSSVVGIDDMEGDGLPDILIGAPGNSDGGSEAGKIYLIYSSSLSSSSTTIPLSTAGYQFTGSVDDLAGSSLASADVDGDRLPDLLIGAPDNDEGGSRAGKVYLVLGSSLSSISSPMDLSMSNYQFIGESRNDNAGESIAGVGDVDGNGLADILIGAPNNTEGGGTASGKVYLILSDNHCDPLLTADTLYVDSLTGTSAGPGGPDCPYDTITAGINESVSRGVVNQVQVEGWFYDEIVTLETGIELVGNIRTSFFVDVPPIIYYSGDVLDYLVTGANEATIENFVIDGGVLMDGVNNMIFRKNYIYHQKGHALSGYAPLHLTSGASDNTIENNIIYSDTNYEAIINLDSNSNENIFINNTLHSTDAGGIAGNGPYVVGIYLAEYTNDNEFRNNIIQPKPSLRYGQTSYGFYLENTTTITATIAYNKTPQDNYNVSLDITNLQTRRSCDFENPPPSGTNFHLSSSSICIDRGDPDSSYNDTDNTRNDLGAYGGPEPLEI